jgi:hypothetical protein
MEEFWKKDPELFIRLNTMPKINLAKQFKAIEEERTQILRKEFKRAQLKWLQVF